MPYINVDEAYILDNTGLQVDQVVDLPYTDAGLTDTQKAQARKNIAAGGSNPNLLDNAYFVGGGSQLGDGIFPINQRGQTSYSSAQVTIDRWTLFGGSVVLAADGITVTSSPDFAQVFEPSRIPVGTYTASVKTADGKIGSITFTTTGSQFFAGGAMGDTGVTLNFIDLWAPDKSLFSLQCQGVKIAAAKLEKGTVSTLANDVPPNYWLELQKCKARLRFVPLTRCPIVFASGNAYLDLNGCEMEGAPIAALYTNDGGVIGSSGTSAAITSVTNIAINHNVPLLQFNLTGTISDQVGQIFNTVVQLSSEL